MQIPKLIHQTWKTEKIPEEINFCADSWKKLNPGWEHILWTDEKMDFFVKEHFPEIYGVYCDYPHGIFRSDLFRLLIIYEMGGVYADLDTECIRGLDYLLGAYAKNGQLVISCAHPLYAELAGLNEYYQATFLAASPKNRILKNIIDSIVKKGGKNHKVEDVCKVTGPLAITEFIDKIGPKGNITALKYRISSPTVSIFDVNIIPLRCRLQSISMVNKKKFYPETCIVHYWCNSHSRSKMVEAMSKKRLDAKKSFIFYIFFLCPLIFIEKLAGRLGASRHKSI